MPWLAQDSVNRARAAAVLRDQVAPELSVERTKFARALPGAVVVPYRTHHYQFLAMPDDTERRIRSFLSSANVRQVKISNMRSNERLLQTAASKCRAAHGDVQLRTAGPARGQAAAKRSALGGRQPVIGGSK